MWGMSKEISSAAQELLSLELKQKTNPFSDQEQERWEELVVQIFGNESSFGRRRRSFRIQANAKCTIKMQDMELDCQLSDISLLGFCFINDAFRPSSPTSGFVSLETVQVENQNIK